MKVLMINDEKISDNYKSNSLSIITLYGASGCGKRTMINLIAKELNVSLITIDPHNFIKAKTIDKLLELKRKTILLITRIETLDEIMLNKLFLSLKYSLHNQNNLVVVATVSGTDIITGKLLQAIYDYTDFIYVPFPDQAARLLILKQYLQMYDCCIPADIDLDFLASNLTKLTHGDIIELCNNVKKSALVEQLNILEERSKYEDIDADEINYITLQRHHFEDNIKRTSHCGISIVEFYNTLNKDGWFSRSLLFPPPPNNVVK